MRLSQALISKLLMKLWAKYFLGEIQMGIVCFEIKQMQIEIKVA